MLNVTHIDGTIWKMLVIIAVVRYNLTLAWNGLMFLSNLMFPCAGIVIDHLPAVSSICDICFPIKD